MRRGHCTEGTLGSKCHALAFHTPQPWAGARDFGCKPPPAALEFELVKKPDDTPYCNSCGYQLTGLTESSRCPECGKPIVEVLVRPSFFGQGRRYTSARKLFGLPIVALASGPSGMEKYGAPVGIIAIGDRPSGVIAIGGAPVGIIAIGGVARGLFAFGGCAIGGIALGGFSVGVLACGGFALGAWAVGGMALVLVNGWGNVINIWPW